MPYIYNPFTDNFDNTGTSSGGTVTSVSGTADRITSTGGTTPQIDIAPTYVGQTSLTTLGTIATGVWNATSIGPTKGGTGISTYATGDMLYASSANTLSKLGVGSNTNVLTLVGGVPTWAAPATSGTVTSVTGTTNRITSTGGTTPQIDISGSYVGQSSITTLGTVGTGVWNGTAVGATFGGTGQTTWATGDLLYASGANTLAKLTAGSNTNVLTLTGGVPVWAAPATSGTVTSVSGTANRITSTGGTTPVIDISASYVGQSSITTLGTIATGVWNGTNIPLGFGGTNAALVASNGGIFYSTATAGAILSGTATANKVLMSGATAAPTWSVPTFPNASATTRKIIVSDGTNWVASTETYAVPGTSGNVLTSDGTNWTSAAPASGGSYAISYISGQFNPLDSTTYYLTPATWGSSSNNSNRIWITKNGTITKVYGGMRVSSTLGSSENSTVSIRLNDTTNTAISSTVKCDATDTNFSNTGLSIAVAAGDYINIIIATPAWVTNPLTVFLNASILIT